MLATNMGTRRQQIEAQYVRKLLLMDVDVLLSTSGSHSVASSAATEAERAQRKIAVMIDAAKRRNS